MRYPYPFTVYVPQVLYDRYQAEVDEEMVKDASLTRDQTEAKVRGSGYNVEPVPLLPPAK